MEPLFRIQSDGCGEQCKWVWSNTGAAGQWMNDFYWGGYDNCVDGPGKCMINYDKI